MKRTVSLVFVVLLATLCAATAAHADTGFQIPTVVYRSASLNILWNGLSAALPWLTGLAKPAQSVSTKELPPPPPPVIRPMGVCIDPDGARVPCAPIL